jgi:hypothetical protein
MKIKICTQCKMKDLCDGLPGFCMFLPYMAIAVVVVLFFYLIFNSKL